MIPISERKRIVVKVGTSTLTHRTGRLNIRRVEQLVKTLADLQNAGHEVILVSSGAIGLGMGKLGLMDRPKDTPGKQACAAVGQCELMYLYDNLFSEYSITVAQLLLTKYILLEDRRKNVENALERLISQGVIPVVREISEDIHAVAGGAGTKFGTGGMATKIHAVEIAYESDIDVVLMNGQHPKKLYELFEDKPVGTLFHKG